MSILVPETGVIAASRRRSTVSGTPTVLGYNTKGATSDTFVAGRSFLGKFTLASAGTLTELHQWVLGGAGTSECRIVIYDDDGTSGAPGTRLAYTNALTFPASVDTHLQETGFSVALAAGDYWVGYIQGVSGGAGYRESTGGTHQFKGSVSYSPPPNPWGTADSSGTRKLSCWAIVLV